MKNKMWPSQVRVLNGNDICKGASEKGSRCCLTGWVDRIFTNKKANEAVCEKLGIVLGIENSAFVRSHIQGRNDEEGRTLRENAVAFNKTIAQLGYDVHPSDLKV